LVEAETRQIEARTAANYNPEEALAILAAQTRLLEARAALIKVETRARGEHRI